MYWHVIRFSTVTEHRDLIGSTPYFYGPGSDFCSATGISGRVFLWLSSAPLSKHRDVSSYLKVGHNILCLHPFQLGRASVVGVATRYGLDGPEMESRWGWDIAHPFRTALRSTQLPVKLVPDLFPGSKAAGAWLWPPPPHLERRLKKEKSHTSTPPLGLHGLL